VFVSGAKSSNGRVLFEAVRAANPDSHKIENVAGLRPEWFEGKTSVGVCGATSTPRWLMEAVAEAVSNGITG
jgi:4-hydroxy-3-methylbut-2-enyl diphosphate reductase